MQDLDEDAARRLVAHGEDLFVEFKQELPSRSGLGAAVASFANTLGGWLIVGIADDRTVVGWSPTPGTDMQSHIGNLLRNQVDPLPPFVAETRLLEGKQIAVIRVFESS